MLVSRTTVRGLRTQGTASIRHQPVIRGQRRLATQTDAATKHDSVSPPARAKDAEPAAQRGTKSLNPAFVGGLAGGGAVLLLGYSCFSGAKSAVNSISQTKQYATQMTEKMKQKAPEPNEALQWLRETTQAYAGLIPGARGYVDKAFDDLDSIHEKHGPEVEQIISDTYSELRRVAKEKGASVEGIYAAWSQLERCIRKIGSLTGDAAEEIMNNHPELKEKLGGNVQALRSMGANYGPEAREQVNKTFDEVRQIFSQGTTAQAIQQAQQLIEEKSSAIRQMGDDLWQRGLQQAQPYLQKSPKAEQLIEENQDTLKQGNLGHLWAQVRNAADTGNTQQIEDFIQHTKEQVQTRGGSNGGSTNTSSKTSSTDTYSSNLLGSEGGSNTLQSVAGGSELLSKIQALTEITQKRGEEAERLLKSTIDEIGEVIQRKTQEAQSIATRSRGEKS